MATIITALMVIIMITGTITNTIMVAITNTTITTSIYSKKKLTQ
jgi:hypothetical protein